MSSKSFFLLLVFDPPLQDRFYSNQTSLTSLSERDFLVNYNQLDYYCSGRQFLRSNKVDVLTIIRKMLSTLVV